MIRFLILVLLVSFCANVKAQSNGRPITAKEPTSSNVNSGIFKECAYKAVEVNGEKQRDFKQVQCVLDKNKGGIYALYHRALMEDPKLSGKMEFSFHIDSDGRVQNARIAHSSLNNPYFENKLLEKLKTLQWPPMADVSWSGSYPFSFYSSKGKP